MLKKQRRSKEEMYLTIELWQESGLTQSSFCEREKLGLPTFGYWLKKYRNEKGSVHAHGSEQAFIPVEVPGPCEMERQLDCSDKIEVSFPNGVSLSCPSGIDINQLKILINF